MTEVKDNSSLPLLLSITGAVLAVAVGGWFLLNQEPVHSTPTAAIEDAPVEEQAETADAADEPAADEPAAEPQRAAGITADVDAELRKARLAADAEIFIFPATQSAFYYYNRVLRADPGHAVANAELEAMLARLATTVAQHLEAQEFANAYEIATIVGRLRPEHFLVLETQRVLDDYTEQLVAEAIQLAQDGGDRQAEEVLATAAALPGRNPDYFTAVSASITDIREVRQAAEKDRAKRAQLAENDARAAWVASIRNAVADGNLVTPTGASARDLLAERNSWPAERTQLTSELVDALVDAAEALIAEKKPTDAELLVNAAVELGGDAERFDAVNAALENAFIELESNRVASVSQLVRVKTASPKYPRRAKERDISGWVDVYFTVSPAGETANVSVYRSDPESVFDRAAVEAVEKWTFQPVEYRGQVIAQRAGARLVFKLE